VVTPTGPPAIGDLGLLGDTRTAALVDTGGRVVWLCLPHFDGEPVFGELIAGAEGGVFTLGPAGDADVLERRYRDGSAVLETTWRSGGGELVLTEGMIAEVEGALLPTSCLVRRIEARGRPVDCTFQLDPRFGRERRRPSVRSSPAVLVFFDRGVALSFTADRELVVDTGLPVAFTLEPGRPLTTALTAAHRTPLIYITPGAAWRALEEDDARWRRWSAGVDLTGPFAAAVQRSVITLRLLTYSPSGAPVAAATTSLPEQPGGARNWDYRFAWPRDASIGIGAFLGVGMYPQARAFLYWLLHASRLDRPRLPALLTVHGRSAPPEQEVPEWPGYAGSRPVRFGNDARDQHQLDNYGWVLDAMWLLERAGHRTDLDAAVLILPLLGLEPPGSPLVVGTVDAVRRELSAGGPLLYRYTPGDDGLAGDEGAFLPCSFWLVQALAATGAVDRAMELMENLLGLAGPLGLFAEEADPATGQQVGNYPQAFTHATLVQAALAIRDATTDPAAAPARSRTRREQAG
jgi:GH15 family glucan-1,4-alpha-glucosidase